MYLEIIKMQIREGMCLTALGQITFEDGEFKMCNLLAILAGGL